MVMAAGVEIVPVDATSVDAATVEGAVLRDGPGRAWGDALGFQIVHETVLQELVLATTDRCRWQVPTPAGYQLRWWACDTAVPAEHRGHGLGLALKTRMPHSLTTDRPTTSGGTTSGGRRAVVPH
jgi:hypothetical protein